MWLKLADFPELDDLVPLEEATPQHLVEALRYWGVFRTGAESSHFLGRSWKEKCLPFSYRGCKPGHSGAKVIAGSR